MTDSTVRDEQIAGLRLLITYKDSQGEVSDREITVRAISEGYIHAYCHLASAPRQFRLDRVQSSADPRTGEVGDEPLAMLASAWRATGGADNVLTAPPARRPADQGTAADRYRAGLRILAWLAWIDGQAHPREREVMAHYADSRCAGLVDVDVPALVAWGLKQRPEWEDIENAVRRVITGDTHTELLRRCAGRLIDADAIQHPEEFTAILDLFAEIEREREAEAVAALATLRERHGG